MTCDSCKSTFGRQRGERESILDEFDADLLCFLQSGWPASELRLDTSPEEQARVQKRMIMYYFADAGGIENVTEFLLDRIPDLDKSLINLVKSKNRRSN